MSLYNPLRMPCSYALSKDHAKATAPGNQEKDAICCPCCLLPIKDTPLPINFNLEELDVFGKEYSEVFHFSKLILVALIILAIDTGLPALQDSVMLGDSAILPLGNHEIRLSPLQGGFPTGKFAMLSILSFMTIFIVLLVFRILTTVRNTEKRTIGQQKWSLLLKNIPKSEDIKQKIHNLFETNFDGIEIQQILLIAKFTEYQLIRKDINQKVSEWKNTLADQNRSKEDILKCLKSIEAGIKRMEEWKIQNKECEGERFSGNAIVTFSDAEKVQEILKTDFLTKNKIEASFGEVLFDESTTMEISQAASPQEIRWMDLGIPLEEKRGNQRLSFIYMFLLVGFFMLIYFLTQLIFGRELGIDEQGNINRPASILGLTFLSILQFSALIYFLQVIQNQQAFESQTEFQLAFMRKYSIFTLFFRTVIIISVESIYYKGPSIAMAAANKITVMLIIDLVLGSIMWLVNPNYLIKKIRQKYLADRNAQTQEQANKLFQKVPFSPGLKYSFLLNMFWYGTVLANVVPIGSVLIPVTLCVYYWTNKLNFSRRESLNLYQLNIKLFITRFISYLEWSLFLKPLLNILLWSIAHEQCPIQQIFMFILGIAYNILNKKKLVSKVIQLLKLNERELKIDPNNEGTRYETKRFRSLYVLEYPITKDLEKKKMFLQRILHKPITFRSEIEMGSKINDEINEEIRSGGNEIPVETERQMN